MAKESSSEYETAYKADYQSDWAIHQNYVQDFDAYEAMLISEVWDSVSKSIDGAKMTDGYITTLAKERADRVMAKLPDGVTESVGSADVGKAAFMDILRQKYIYPNANAQHPFLEKLNMWQLYSSVYGYMPMMYDWNVAPSGYVGPDCWLWNPRNLVPQQGRTSLADMDYVTALTWVGKKYLQNILDNPQEDDGWDREALAELVGQADKEIDVDTHKDTLTERTRILQSRKKGICLATRYEVGPDGKWCTFAPDHGYIQVREIPNPHKNGKIPFVIKYSQPLFDSFYGLGDFQRGRGLQFGRDGLRNFYFKGIKMNLIPPIVANANGVIKHTLDYREGGVLLETMPNSIRRLETSPAGLNTYQAAQSDLTGSLLSMFGTQNASLPGAEALNPSQGKTPAAISFYGDKEASRDGSELRHLESAIEQLVDGFNSLIVNMGTEDIPLSLFAEDIKDIMDSGMEDIIQLFPNFRVDQTGSALDLTINPTVLRGVEYRFRINPNSTQKANQQMQQQQLEQLMTTIGKFQNIFKDDPRINVNWPEIMRAYEEVSGVKGASRFISIDPNAPAQSAPPPKSPSETLNYKDAPEDIKRQLEAAAGLQPSQMPNPEIMKAQQDMAIQSDKANQEMALKRAANQMDMEAKQQDMAMKADSHDLEVAKSIDSHQTQQMMSAQSHEAQLAQGEQASQAKIEQAKKQNALQKSRQPVRQPKR